jgi:hypothetical protein
MAFFAPLTVPLRVTIGGGGEEAGGGMLAMGGVDVIPP